MNQTKAGKQALILEKREIINMNIQFSFMFYIIPIYIIIVLLNLTVLILLRESEKTIVNRLMKLDCLINILYATLGTFKQSPCFKGLGQDMFCYSHTMLSYVTVVFNRLLPVAIAPLRYFRHLLFPHFYFFKILRCLQQFIFYLFYLFLSHTCENIVFFSQVSGCM